MRDWRLLAHLRHWRRDERGNIAIMTAMLAVPLIGAAGLGLDYTRSTAYRTQLDSAAAASSLAAIDTARALLATNANTPDADVIAAAKARAENVFAARAPKTSDISLLNATTTVKRSGETVSSSVSYNAKVATTFAAIVGVADIGVDGAAASNGPLDATPSQNSDPNLLIKENFDSRAISGVWEAIPNYNNWITTGLGLEIGLAPAYGGSPPNGAKLLAELDGYNNTRMSKQVYLPIGNYELRYWVKDRLVQTLYTPAWICGSQSGDVDWATDASQGFQTNRVGVYLDIARNDTPPSSFSPTTNNLIDACVSSGNRWIERSVKITMNQPSSYWLTFQGEGASDGFGAVISDIRLCKGTCAGTPSANFPWTAGQTLFSDSFETPTGTTYPDQTLDASGSNTGWTQLPVGWTTYPLNQMDFKQWKSNATLGAYQIELDASFPSPTNRGISRKLLLAPGYFELKYYYMSVPNWGTEAQVACGLSDIPGQLALTASQTSGSSRAADSARVGVYIDADQNVSHPETPAVLRATAVWKNPDGSTEVKPRLPVTPVDACMYAGAAGTLRTVNVRIVKPGFYWMTFRAEGTQDNSGGAIDVVTLKALGSLATTAPANVITIPQAGLAPGAAIVMNGLQIAAQ